MTAIVRKRLWLLVGVLMAGLITATLTARAEARGHRHATRHVRRHSTRPHPQAYSRGAARARKVHLIIGGKGGGTDPGDDYPASLRNAPQDSRLDPWREYNRECTSFVAWALASRNGFTMPFYANARDWGAKAQALGYRVDNTPAPGSVAWSTAGVYGHVAYVEDVIGSSVHIEEYNHLGNGTYTSRVLPASHFTGYIHFRDLAAAPVVSAPPATPPVSAPTPSPQQGLMETTGGVTHTWSNPATASGNAGPDIASNQTVQIVCKVSGFTVGDGNAWWYLIGSGPWSSAYYASADAFYNNGRTSGSLQGTPFVDPAVPACPSAPTSPTPNPSPSPSPTPTPTPAPPPSPAPAPAPQTWAETVGGVTHTWTDYTSAGGSQGPSIQTSQTVQVACKVQGFRVADGDTWWYRIASSPWSGSYYASADAFYNNGQTSGSLHGTPFVDNNVANC